MQICNNFVFFFQSPFFAWWVVSHLPLCAEMTDDFQNRQTVDNAAMTLAPFKLSMKSGDVFFKTNLPAWCRLRINSLPDVFYKTNLPAWCRLRINSLSDSDVVRKINCYTKIVFWLIPCPQDTNIHIKTSSVPDAQRQTWIAIWTDKWKQQKTITASLNISVIND